MRSMIKRSGPPRFPIPNARIFITILNWSSPWFIPERRSNLVYNKRVLMNSLGLEDELFRAVEDYNTRAVGLSGSVTPGSGWDTALNRPYKRAMATAKEPATAFPYENDFPCASVIGEPGVPSGVIRATPVGIITCGAEYCINRKWSFMSLRYVMSCMLIAGALLASPELSLGRGGGGGGGHRFGGGFHGGGSHGGGFGGRGFGFRDRGFRDFDGGFFDFGYPYFYPFYYPYYYQYPFYGPYPGY
jgi:hypothetical protein